MLLTDFKGSSIKVNLCTPFQTTDVFEAAVKFTIWIIREETELDFISEVVPIP